jgi:hypothetical protein
MRAILVDWLVEVHLKFKVCDGAPERYPGLTRSLPCGC